MKVLIISRAHPPIVGGIEKQNCALARALSGRTDVTVVANTKGKKYLPLFFFVAFLKGLAQSRNSDVILLGDGVLAPLGWLLRKFSGKPVVSIVHGLDITFDHPLYQKVWIRFFLKRLDALFAVGHETIRQAVSRGIDEAKCLFIPNGVECFGVTKDAPQARAHLELDAGKVYLVTLGRLVKRKGVAWFVENVVPELPDNVHYLIAGEGIDKDAIERLVDGKSLQKRVSLLGRLNDREKCLLLQAADIFVQPNIRVAGDMEGFGLVVLEAASAGLPVVASALEGLKDAINHEQNGLLVEHENPQAFIQAITELANDPQKRQWIGEKAKQYVEAHCLWEHIASQYHSHLRRVVSKTAR